MIKFGFAAVAAVLAAGVSAAPVDPATTFNGPFVGIQGGWQQDRLSLSSVDKFGNFGYGRRTADGFGYGGQVGYDYRLPSNFVLGAEVAVTGKTGSDYLVDSFGDVTNERYGRTVNATGRLGFVFPSTGGLGYVRGGYSNTRILLTDAVTRNGYNRDGYTVGAGYEQPVARHVSARIEYDYSDYGHGDASATAVDYGLAGGTERLHRNAVTAGLNFHF
jgi:outer membrane immunogenic protein